MSTLAIPSLVTPEEYLQAERKAQFKSEYVDGYVYAMSGASTAHLIITGNTFAALHSQLKGGHCRPFVSDMRVRVSRRGPYYYPDIAVACKARVEDEEEQDNLLNPRVVIEVLSPSTQRYDRTEKFARYREMPSLEQYVLIAQDRIGVEHHELHGAKWVFTLITDPQGVVDLPSIGARVKIADIYEGVAFKTTRRRA